MGKAARVRAARKLAELATVGESADVTKAVARRIRNEAAEARRTPHFNVLDRLEHVARTQPPEHRRLPDRGLGQR